MKEAINIQTIVDKNVTNNNLLFTHNTPYEISIANGFGNGFTFMVVFTFDWSRLASIPTAIYFEFKFLQLSPSNGFFAALFFQPTSSTTYNCSSVAIGHILNGTNNYTSFGPSTTVNSKSTYVMIFSAKQQGDQGDWTHYCAMYGNIRRSPLWTYTRTEISTGFNSLSNARASLTNFCYRNNAGWIDDSLYNFTFWKPFLTKTPDQLPTYINDPSWEHELDFKLTEGWTEVDIDESYKVTKLRIDPIFDHYNKRSNDEVYFNNIDSRLTPPKTVQNGTFGTKPNVSDTDTHAWKTVIDAAFEDNILQMVDNLDNWFTPVVRKTDTTEDLQNVINAIQNGFDNAWEGVTDSGIWILTQMIKTFTPLINAGFSGFKTIMENNVLSFLKWIIGLGSSMALSAIKSISDSIIGLLNSLTTDLLNIVDAQIDTLDLTEYYNSMIALMDMSDDPTPSVTLAVPGIGIGFETLSPGTLVVPSHVKLGIIPGVDFKTEDIVFFLYWLWKLPSYSIIGVSVPLGLFYWVLKDLEVPFSGTLSPFMVEAGFYSGWTNKFSFKDATLTLFIIDIGYKIARFVGIRGVDMILLFKKVLTGRLKPNVKDAIKRLKPDTEALKYNSSNDSIYDEIKSLVIELTEDTRSVHEKLNYIVGYTYELMAYLSDPVHNVLPKQLDPEDLYGGVKNP